jgi:(E)-4-hydroxy-3-methylbut-2-enyl-diphosphate synthase
MAQIQRRKTVTATIGVRVGSDAPVVVQSMTNTDTADIPSTVKQVAASLAPDPNWSESQLTTKTQLLP